MNPLSFPTPCDAWMLQGTFENANPNKNQTIDLGSDERFSLINQIVTKRKSY